MEEKAVHTKTPSEVEETCERCGGEGSYLIAKLYPQGHTEVNETCDECNGEGLIIKKIVVLVKTQAEFDRVIKSFNNHLDSTDFENYRSKTGICLADGRYGSLGHFEEYKDEYTTISYDEWAGDFSPSKSSQIKNIIINIPLVSVPKKDNIKITVNEKKNTIKIPLINENKFGF